MKSNLAEISKELNRLSGFGNVPNLIFMTDCHAQPYPEDIIESMPEGSMVILRDYDVENRYGLGKALAYICKSKNIKFLVAGDLSLSLMLGADGIHLPEHMVGQATNIRKECPDYFITAAVHDESSVKVATTLPIDAVLLAPIFSTPSHPETFDDGGLTIGPEKLSKICKQYKIAIYALGGITDKTANKLLKTGTTGIAAIRGI